MLARWYPLLDTRSPEKWVDHLGKTARGGADEAASWTPSHGAARWRRRRRGLERGHPAGRPSQRPSHPAPGHPRVRPPLLTGSRLLESHRRAPHVRPSSSSRALQAAAVAPQPGSTSSGGQGRARRPAARSRLRARRSRTPPVRRGPSTLPLQPRGQTTAGAERSSSSGGCCLTCGHYLYPYPERRGLFGKRCRNAEAHWIWIKTSLLGPDFYPYPVRLRFLGKRAQESKTHWMWI
ncbi:unnamed protein product [Prorocentrum cordatum]|uniref:Uncharacterized protein n=1 Tax=Prorocentrum cordatum TaxID=2364126 RepID=A0ABN9U5P3_9DINO|nr:unnamed protein product [Polarella glacialis]